MHHVCQRPWSNKRGPIIASKERKKKDGEGQRFGYFWFFFTAPFKKFSHLLKIISSTWLSIVWRSWYILLWESIIEFFDFAVYIYICDIPYMKFRQLRCRNCMPHQETMGCKLCAYDTWKCLQDLYAIKYYAVQYWKWTIASGFFLIFFLDRTAVLYHEQAKIAGDARCTRFCKLKAVKLDIQSIYVFAG